MSTFSFNFNIQASDDNHDNNNIVQDNTNVNMNENNSATIEDAKLLNMLPFTNMVQIREKSQLLDTMGGVIFRKVEDTKNSVLPGLEENSDLVPGVYEGGLKVWECSLDLINYLHTNQLLSNMSSNFTVLELGCGHGFPGIYALKMGGIVSFSDYNQEVLEHVTWPNVQLNVENEMYFKRCSFWSGDWMSMSGMLKELGSNKSDYDLILTAETLYTIECTEKVVKMIHNHLKYPSGIAFVAAKRYYFGCGGSTDHFKDLIINDKNFKMTCEIVTVTEDGRSNIREILIVKFA